MIIRIRVLAGNSGVGEISFGGVNVNIGDANYTDIQNNKPEVCVWTAGAQHQMNYGAGRFVNNETYTIIEATDAGLKLTCPTPASPDITYRP
ncbi:hypothetical protein [Vibrio quintilis]|uniref:Uncharacterized protein n=1 Tax=Vibrio quintilis TaxID=1117707 RepID=A0A1M7YZN7_9VIBR|nr:hypothetical protein [Vibrio quintilis]SHO57906.1 hypothetical protein VQ7734_03676 [Vibrio quintilis]